MEAWQVRQRNKEYAKSPTRAWIEERNSTTTKDEIGPWFKQSGLYADGKVFPANEWTMFSVLASQAGVIERLRIQTNPTEPGDAPEHAELYLAAFAQEVQPAYLNSRIPNPSAEGAPELWENHHNEMVHDKRFIDVWGVPDQPGGYSPRKKREGVNPTGQIQDRGSWTFDTRGGEPLIWFLLYPTVEVKIENGRILWITPAGW
jgi:hypothetical protein